MRDYTAFANSLRALNSEYQMNTLGVREPLIDQAADVIEHLSGLAAEYLDLYINMQKKYVADTDALFLARKDAERRLNHSTDQLVTAPDGEEFRAGECQGHDACPVETHEHGCFADIGNCNHPEEHKETEREPTR